MKYIKYIFLAENINFLMPNLENLTLWKFISINKTKREKIKNLKKILEINKNMHNHAFS